MGVGSAIASEVTSNVADKVKSKFNLKNIFKVAAVAGACFVGYKVIQNISDKHKGREEEDYSDKYLDGIGDITTEDFSKYADDMLSGQIADLDKAGVEYDPSRENDYRANADTVAEFCNNIVKCNALGDKNGVDAKNMYSFAQVVSDYAQSNPEKMGWLAENSEELVSYINSGEAEKTNSDYILRRMQAVNEKVKEAEANGTPLSKELFESVSVDNSPDVDLSKFIEQPLKHIQEIKRGSEGALPDFESQTDTDSAEFE